MRLAPDADLIPTYKQWDAQYRRTLSRENGITQRELADMFDRDCFLPQWWNEALDAYDRGAVFSTQHWNSLNHEQRLAVLNRPRAQKIGNSNARPWAAVAS